MMVLPDIYANAGGVTVSYFEWLKNLSHVRFGRMQKRLEERDEANFVRAIERLTGKSVSDDERRVLVSGAGEEDIVNSGLEETMIVAYHGIRDALKREPALGDLARRRRSGPRSRRSRGRTWSLGCFRNGFRVPGFRVPGSWGFGVRGSGFGVRGSGFGVRNTEGRTRTRNLEPRTSNLEPPRTSEPGTWNPEPKTI